MKDIEQLIRSGSAGTELILREALYGADEDAAVIADCLALANAESRFPFRYVVFGIDDTMDDEHRFVGVRKDELVTFKRRFLTLIADGIEPELRATVRAIRIDNLLFGFIRIEDCVQRPYLTKRPIAPGMPAGVGITRRGAGNLALTRSALQRLFANSANVSRTPHGITIGFPGDPLLRELSLPVLALKELPSEIAAAKLRALLHATDQQREQFGGTQTHIMRLVHAKLFGAHEPYNRRSDDSLAEKLASVARDYSAADEHYLYEKRAHKINLVIDHRGDAPLSNVSIRLTTGQLPGFGIADRIYPEPDGARAASGYPQVLDENYSTVVAEELGTLHPRQSSNVFREPLRVWTREQAAGRTPLLEYRLTADELAEPLTGYLTIRIVKPAAKAPSAVAEVVERLSSG